eukprot:502734_1
MSQTEAATTARLEKMKERKRKKKERYSQILGAKNPNPYARNDYDTIQHIQPLSGYDEDINKPYCKTYGFTHDQIWKKFIGFGCKSLFCMKCAKNLPHSKAECSKDYDRADVSSNMLGWKVLQPLLLDSFQDARKINVQRDVGNKLTVQTTFDCDRKIKKRVKKIAVQHMVPHTAHFFVSVVYN